MLAGQIALKTDAYRGRSFLGELRLQDWFVPVLYQEELDPQLVAGIPGEQVREELRKARILSLGKLPPEPAHTFVGRSRELLYAERILEQQQYMVFVGEGGEGKTTLAAELARWLVATSRFDRAAFVTFDRVMDAEAALSFLGDQLVPNYQSIAGQGENRGWLEVERALREQRVVIVLDNLETLLKPPAIGYRV
jgi:Mrp family chromosome partitioning ATPase